jgi:hypothetical protein
MGSLSQDIVRRNESRTRLRQMEKFLAGEWDKAQKPDADPNILQPEVKTMIAAAYSSVVSALEDLER